MQYAESVGFVGVMASWIVELEVRPSSMTCMRTMLSIVNLAFGPMDP